GPRRRRRRPARRTGARGRRRRRARRSSRVDLAGGLSPPLGDEVVDDAARRLAAVEAADELLELGGAAALGRRARLGEAGARLGLHTATRLGGAHAEPSVD